MKNLRLPLTIALAAVAVLALGALASDDPERTQFKVFTSDAGRAEFELEELALGETRSYTSDQGKAVEVTRTETGYTLDIDGKKVEIKLTPDATSAFAIASGEGEGEGDHREVIVMKKGGAADAADRQVMIVTAGDDAAGKKVITKRIVTRVGGEDGEHVQVKVVGDNDGETEAGEEVEVLDLEALAGTADGKGHVVVIRKSGEGNGEPHTIEVRVQKKVEAEDDENNE